MIALAIIYALLGIIVKFGKQHKILSFYRMLSEEEQKLIHTEKMNNIFMSIMLLMAAALTTVHFGLQVDETSSAETMTIIIISLTGVVAFMACKPIFNNKKES